MLPLNRCLIAIFACLPFIVIFGSVSGVMSTNVTDTSNNTDVTNTAKSSDGPSSLSSRNERVLRIFQNNPVRGVIDKRPIYNQPVMHPRVDRFPGPNAIQQQHLPVVYKRRTVASALRPEVLRRVQSNPYRGYPFRSINKFPPHHEIAKNSQYSNVKDGPYHATSFKNGPSNIPYHQNSLIPAQNFKPSPNFNGKVKVRHFTPQQLQQKQHELYQREKFTPANPQNQQQQQQQKQESLSHFHYQQPQKQQPQQEPLLQQKLVAPEINLPVYPPERPSPKAVLNTPYAPTGYAVYEDPETTFETSENYISDEDALKEAQEYLRFMSSNSYFLPKRDPNYKYIDVDRDSLRYQQRQKSPGKSGQSHQYQLQQQSYGKSAYDSVTEDTKYPQHHLEEKLYSNHHQPSFEVGQLFYGEEHLTPSSSSPPPQLSVRSLARDSYPNTQNEFIVNSDGKKAVKRIVSAHQVQHPSITTPFPSAYSYQHFHFNSLHDQTPEPTRFEFTERDAMSPVTHTHSPPTNGQLRRTSQEIPTNHIGHPSSKAPTRNHGGIDSTRKPISHKTVKPAREDFNDDLEDDEDIIKTGARTPTELRDTEDYCESTCSNIQDDDEDIICGSDGYMYTSEAQMECYASCLHIDVTIQTKGNCSAR